MSQYFRKWVQAMFVHWPVHAQMFCVLDKQSSMHTPGKSSQKQNEAHDV